MPETPIVLPPAPSLYMGFGAGYDGLFAAATKAGFRANAPIRPIRFPSQQDGWFGNAFIGWKSNDPNATISQAEIYTRLTGNTEFPRFADTNYQFSMVTPGRVRSTPIVEGRPKGEEKKRLLEIGARLRNGNAHDLLDTGGSSFGIEPFLAHYQENTNVYLTNANAEITRSSDVDAWIGGLKFSAETSYPLTDALHAVFNASAGVYAVTATGHYDLSMFITDTQVAYYRDSRSTIGGRFGGEARLVHELSRNVRLAAVAGLDYWTSLPTARMTGGAGHGARTRTGFHDALHVNAGLELTFALGN